MNKADACAIPELDELKKLGLEGLSDLAENIRSFLIDSISKTGGHIGANLSVIELTIAIHRVFESPQDKILFDTGHQGYTHKLLTGRQALFSSLNQWQGMNRFIARDESEHDAMDATHAGTSLSIACGYSRALKNSGSENYVVALIGDGTLVEGMAFEGLNFSSEKRDLNLVIIVNDNEMAIAPTVGGMSKLTKGDDWIEKSQAFFGGLGLGYIPIADGHDVGAVIEGLHAAKAVCGPVVVHVKTEKGKGLSCAKEHPYKMHFSMPFDPQTGEGASATVLGRTYAVVGASQLLECMEADDSVYALTAATPYASALDECLARFPERAIDVGMAEQHAVGMACGLALGGKKPVVCMQTTFMQRAFDQLLHDACFMNLPVTMLGVRAGFAGYDGSTHHGLYDIPYLRSFPNMQVVYPADSKNLALLIKARLENPQGPMTILYPYEPVPVPEPDAGVLEPCGLSVAAEGKDGLILCLGNRLVDAHKLRDQLKAQAKDYGLACVQTIKPFPSQRLLELVESVEYIVTLEESVLNGGFGSLVLEVLSDSGVSKKVFRSGVDDSFVPPGSKDECSKACGITPGQIVSQLAEKWAEFDK